MKQNFADYEDGDASIVISEPDSEGFSTFRMNLGAGYIIIYVSKAELEALRDNISELIKE